MFVKRWLLLVGLTITLSVAGYSQGGGIGVNQDSSPMAVRERTVVLDLRERVGMQGHVWLRKVAEYHGRYYCMFTCNIYYLFGGNNEMLYAIDSSTLEAIPLPCPTEFGHYRDDLFVRHDTLFLDIYGSWCKNDFWFDTTALQWVECPEVYELVYEDDDVSVYEMDNGEWGQALWFQHHRSGKECALPGLGAVRRVGDTFFVVEPNLVRSVTLHQLDTATPSMIDHRLASENDTAIRADSSPWLEGDTVYIDPRYDDFLSYIGKYNDTVIVGSVTLGGRLVLFVDRPDGTALMCVEGRHALQSLLPLGERYNINIWNLVPRGNIHTGRIIVPFQQDFLNMGFVDLGDGQVDIINLRLLIDTLPLQATDGLDSLLAFLEEGWGSINDSAVLVYERSHGGFFMAEDSLRNAYFEDVGLTDSSCRTLLFRKRVDTLYNIGTQYCVLRENRRVAAVFFGFGLPQHYMPGEWTMWDSMTPDERRDWTKRRAAAMTARLDAIYGPHSNDDGEELRWTRGRMTLILYPSSNRLMIY